MTETKLIRSTRGVPERIVHHLILHFVFVWLCVSFCPLTDSCGGGNGRMFWWGQLLSLLFVTGFFHFCLIFYASIILCFVFNFSFEGGVIFIDNNNNKFHIKTFRLVLCVCFCLLKLLLLCVCVLHACVWNLRFFLFLFLKCVHVYVVICVWLCKWVVMSWCAFNAHV